MAKTEIKVGFGDQVKAVSVELPKGEAKPWDADAQLEVVGKPIPRRDGALKVSGRAKYTYDVNLPGMLYAAVVRSPLPAAKVVSVDTSAAEKIAGVKAVVQVAEKGDAVLFAGQDVAAVVAERPEQAWQAARAVKVEYEQRRFVTRLAFAATPDAPLVHRGAVEERRTEGHVTEGGGGDAQGNKRPLRPMKKGDVSKGLKGATVHEAVYETQVQTHSALETHGIVARWDDDEHLTVWASTQSIFSVRDELAEVFDLKPTNVRVHTDYLGGGFGAKFGASAPGSRLGTIAARLAKQTGAPVKLMCDRHEEQVCTGNRPDSIQTVKVAGKGTALTAIEVQSIGTAGIGTGAGVGRNAFAVYTKCPNILVDSSDVFTNAGPGTAMRAPGHPQGAFAFELALDELATKLGVDPIELRLANDEHPVRLWQFEEGAKRFDWKAKRAESKRLREGKARIRRGCGVAASIWGDFGRPKAAVVTCSVLRDGSVEIRNGVQDIGTGIPTVLAQIGAEVFTRPLDTIIVRYGDSELGSSVGSGGSQTTSSVTPAVRNACEDAKEKFIEHVAELLGAKPADVSWANDGTLSAGGASITFAQACKKIPGESITATADRPATYGNHPMPFLGAPMPQIAGVQFAEVEVDTWTGVVRAKHVLAMHDCGRVMNRLTCTSQVNGGVILGTSYALMEQRVMDHDVGRMLNPNLESYKICGAADTPEIEVVLTDVYTGANNTGAAGIGEPSTIPTAAALACAVFDALGEPVRRLPMTPSRVLAALGAVPAPKGLG
ncbi:MAG: xanthine dehydrogenase family protein molybdopterin-binding subunit [Nannocystaceae bacterium]|nr:xanthine dehydrogenase family protein molybdopterin-binding subunit [bacterium]